MRQGLYAALQTVCPGTQVDFPYRLRMRDRSIEELPLSVRSMNGLMRANAGNFGRLWDVMTHGSGLRTVRNLGAKSETEIRQCFFDACFQCLTPGEQAAYCQKVLSDSGPGAACGPERGSQDDSRAARRGVRRPQNT